MHNWQFNKIRLYVFQEWARGLGNEKIEALIKQYGEQSKMMNQKFQESR
jgi:hypothetical protein